MRYSIFEYSQERLLENSLDVVDALILNWFVNFFSGKMEKRIFEECDGSKGLYGWVKPSKIMDDMPVIGIASDKGVRRRLDGLVDKGILNRKTVQFQTGKRSYYRTTELYDSLVNIKANTVTSSNPQRNSSTFAEDSSASENPQRSKTTLAKNETTGKSSQRYSSTSAERNSNTFALNDSKTSDTKTTAATVIESAEKVFGKDAFDEDFPKKALEFLGEKGISDYEGFFEFIKERVEKKQKHVDSPRGMAYKLIFSTDICREYKNNLERILERKKEDEEKERKKKARELTCPICGTKFLPDYLTGCPKCGFEISEFGEEKRVARYKKYLAMPCAERNEYNSELLGFMRKLPLPERLAYLNSEEGKKRKTEFVNALDKKYRLTG